MMRQILYWLDENKDQTGLEDPEIIDKKSGEGNHNFILKDGNKKFVLRVSKKISESRLENEKKILEFLEHQGIENIPSPICFERNQDIGDILLETYSGEKTLEAEDFTERYLRNLARLLSEIHSIPVENYNRFFDENEKKSIKLKELYQEDFRKWSKRPYKEYLENTDSPRKEIQNFYQKQKELLEQNPLDTEIEQAVTHGDLGFNVRAKGEKVFVIDWEFSRISYPGNEILYFFQHEGIKEEQQKIFLDEYRKHRKIESLEEIRDFYEKFLAFNDMIWAANRVEKGEEKHRELLKERLEKLEELYSG